MVTFAQLRDCEPERFRALGGRWSRLWHKHLNGAADDLHAAYRGLAGSWEAPAYDVASDRLEALFREIDDTREPLLAMDRALADLAEDLKHAKAALLDAVDSASRIPAVVSDDGDTITYTGEDVCADPRHRLRIQRRMEAVFDDIDAALRSAATADRACADRLAALVPGSDPRRPHKGEPANRRFAPASVIDPADVPRRGADPATVRRWWDCLSTVEQRYAIHHYPGRIGWLDGIPVAGRDQANKVALARAHEAAGDRRRTLLKRHATLVAALRRAGADPPARLIAELRRVDAELAVIDKNLAGIRTIERRLDHSPKGRPTAYLVGFSPQTLRSDGRAIVAIGNPDTADHVATYVPGTTAELSRVGGDIERADRMASDAHDLAPYEATSVIMWLGYDAPDTVVADAPFEHYADDAAPDLRRFQSGLRASHDGWPSHNTVIGHSYGSTVVGHTAASGGIDADELVFVGSPGVGVDSAVALGIDPKHVWATRAYNDPIQVVAGVPGGLGDDPTDSSFGGRVFPSDSGSVCPVTAAHSEYWDPGNAARDNIGHIVTRQPDNVTLAVGPAFGGRFAGAPVSSAI